MHLDKDGVADGGGGGRGLCALCHALRSIYPPSMLQQGCKLGLVAAALRGGVCRRPAAAGPKALPVGLGQ